MWYIAGFLCTVMLPADRIMHADPAYYTGCNIVFKTIPGKHCGKLCGECGKPFILVSKNKFFVENNIQRLCIFPKNNK
jgi:hypothetical protein